MITTHITALNALKKSEPNPAIGATLLTTQHYPLYYRMITKCGCTYILNLLHYLNKGRILHNPLRVHKHSLVPAATAASNTDISQSPYSFVVIRNPIKRFMSLYFDKLYTPTPIDKKYSMGAYFLKNGLIDASAGTDIAKHRENCINSIRWIAKNISGHTNQPQNWHWKPQKIRLKQVHPFHFNVLILENIVPQLTQTLKPLVPNIENALKTISVQNKSAKPVPVEAVLNDTLRQLISDTYSDDTKIYQEVATYWREFDKEDVCNKNLKSAT